MAETQIVLDERAKTLLRLALREQARICELKARRRRIGDPRHWDGEKDFSRRKR